MARQDPRLRAEAEEIAAQALLFLASEPDRLAGLLEVSGLTPEALRGGAGQPAVMSGVLSYLLNDESLLLVFAAETGIGADRVMAAAAVLDGQTLNPEGAQRLKPRREPKPGRTFR